MPQENELRLANLLRDTGLLSAQEVERALEEQRKSGDRLWDILQRRVSRQSIVDFLRLEIPLPFGRARQRALKEVLLESRIISDEELAAALGSGSPGGGDLGQLLIQAGMVEAEDVEKARREQKDTGLPLWRTLINLNLISPSDLTNILKARLQTPVDSGREDQVIDILLNMGILRPDQLRLAEEAIAGQGTGSKIGWLLEKDIIRPDAIARATEDHLGIPFVRLGETEIDPNVVYTLPERLVREAGVLPIRRRDHELTVAMLNPLAPGLIERIATLTGHQILPVLTTRADLDKQIERYFEKLRPPPEPSLAAATPAAAPDVPAVQLATTIIEAAIASRATDIHMEPQIPEMRVRYRIDGVLSDVMGIPTTMVGSVFSRLKILAGMDITERRRPQDGHISMRLANREINMRVATVPTHLGEKLVIRLLDEANVLRGLRQLGLEEDDETRLRELIELPHGMLLVTGPIGSGKTTTLYAAMNELNILETNVVTIEDPVEYRLPGVSQIQVNYALDLGFAELLRSVLRQDADVLMVGEIRDPETARVAVWAGLTGQLVMATLHTRDAASAVTMMVNLEAPRFVLAESLVGVVAQRLVRKVCPDCRSEYNPMPAVMRALGLEGEPGQHHFVQGAGCPRCQGTGFLGRTGVFEVLAITPEMRELIASQASDSQIEAAARRTGMRGLWDNGLRKVLAGVTTPEEFLSEVSR